MDDLHGAQKEVNIWMEREELLWKQRLCAIWKLEGDQNTRFFHFKASHRKRKNTIWKICEEGGVQKENEKRNQVILDYFIHLFTKYGNGNCTDCKEHLHGRATIEIKADLASEYTKEVVKEALKQIDPLKALELDEMTPVFFQK